MASMEAASAGKVLHGTCGWSDDSIQKCGRVYPSNVRSAVDRLPTYSRLFPCVEVDSSCYAIPQPTTTARWAAAVPTTFRFHFKAFAIFCGQAMLPETLPAAVRALLPQQQTVRRWSLQQLPAVAQEKLWSMWHAAVSPIVKAGVMGCTLFQFQLSFLPTSEHVELLRHLRSQLDASIHMAIEFRNRVWFTDEAQRPKTLALLGELGACLVASDDLQHELYQKDREQMGLQPGQQRKLMPIGLHVTQPAFGYVRVHRRHGTLDRKLTDSELQDWAARLPQYLTSLAGPCYFLWGTDWEDAPLLNAAGLDKALSQQWRFDWKAFLQRQQPRKGSLKALFANAAQSCTKQSAAQANHGAVPGCSFACSAVERRAADLPLGAGCPAKPTSQSQLCSRNTECATDADAHVGKKARSYGKVLKH